VSNGYCGDKSVRQILPSSTVLLCKILTGGDILVGKGRSRTMATLKPDYTRKCDRYILNVTGVI
jgi:hypothetical protein